MFFHSYAFEIASVSPLYSLTQLHGMQYMQSYFPPMKKERTERKFSPSKGFRIEIKITELQADGLVDYGDV